MPRQAKQSDRDAGLFSICRLNLRYCRRAGRGWRRRQCDRNGAGSGRRSVFPLPGVWWCI